MGEIKYLSRARLERQLRSGSAFVGVRTRGPGLQADVPPHLEHATTVGFHVGRALTEPVPVEFHEHHFEALLLFRSVPGKAPFHYRVRVPYRLLDVVRPMHAGGPNGGQRLSA